MHNHRKHKKNYAPWAIAIVAISILVVSLVSINANIGSWAFAVIGDSRNNPTTFKKLLKAILNDADHPDILFHLGDMVNRGSNMDEWAQYKQCVSPLAPRIPVYPVLGNHETFGDNGTKNFINQASPPKGALYYSFVRKDAGFVVLNCYEPKYPQKIGGAQLQWLQTSLLEMKPKVRVIFVFMHHPLLTRPTFVHKEPIANSEEVRHILEKAGVSAVFSAHEHTFDHQERDGIHYFVTAGGGASLYHNKSGNAFHHYSKVVISFENIRVVVVDQTGKERNEFSIPIKN